MSNFNVYFGTDNTLKQESWGPTKPMLTLAESTSYISAGIRFRGIAKSRICIYRDFVDLLPSLYSHSLGKPMNKT